MLICTLLAVAPGFASEAGEQNPAETPIGTLFRWLNLAIVLGATVYVIKKWLAPALQRRATGIGQAISEGASAKADAEQQIQLAEQKLRRLDQEMAELRAAAQREAAAEAERIRAVAREEALKVERAAETEIAAAERAARIELQAIAAQLTIERAEAILRKQMSAEANAFLFRAFLDDLARSAN